MFCILRVAYYEVNKNTLEMQQYEISKEYITNAFMNYTNIQTQQGISIYLYYFGHAQNIIQL